MIPLPRQTADTTARSKVAGDRMHEVTDRLEATHGYAYDEFGNRREVDVCGLAATTYSNDQIRSRMRVSSLVSERTIG